MSTITVFNVWTDTGFTEGSVEVPKRNSTLPSPAYTFEDLNPSKDALFSEIRLKAAYVPLMSASYVEAVVSMNNGSSVSVFGWVDDVICGSDSMNYPQTVIRWHIDYWRTYISQAVFRDGIVKNRPRGTAQIPPQNPSYRFRTLTSEKGRYLIQSQDEWYILLTYVKQNADATTTTSGLAYIPVSTVDPAKEGTASGVSFPSLNSFATGDWDEKLGLDPAAVKGVFLSPVKPGISGWTVRKLSGDYGAYVADTPIGSFSSYTVQAQAKSDDLTSFVVTGFDGETVGTLPWGVEVTTWEYRVVMDSASAYIQLRASGIDSHILGTCFTIPLPALEVTENSWSSYVYSGARKSDMDQRVANTDRNFISGLASTANQAIQGAASGAMLGAIGGPIGAIGGAALGGVTSALGSAISTVSEKAISTAYNDVFQGIDDFSHAHQTDGLLMAGTGFDCLRYGRKGIYLANYGIDAYSQGTLNTRIQLYGARVDEPTPDCTALIEAGGPLRIENLYVGGSIPVQAKQYIKERFRSGVRLV